MKPKDREEQVCQRLREAREALELTQHGCAKQLCIERSTLVNYESGRSPIRLNFGLRFCRQFIISEEWLATGRYDACHESAKAHGQGWDRVLDEQVFRRQCMDLFSEPLSLRLPQNALFSQSYTETLAPLYLALARQSFYNPRIVLHDSDNHDMCINLLTMIHKRNTLLLSNEALRLKRSLGMTRRTYTRCVFETSDLVARKLMGGTTPPHMLESDHWLQRLLKDPKSVIQITSEAEPSEARVPVRKAETVKAR